MAEESRSEHIANQLRRDILRGVLEPGAPIKERDNAQEMGVSRTPMREAIRILAQEGLIQLRPARSPIVAIPDVKEVTDAVEVLLAIEKLSGELACARATDADIEEIAGILRHISDSFDTTDPLDMFEIDMSFHTAIARASHNRALADTHRSFLQRLWRARYLSAIQRRNRERVITQHGAIVDALRARQPDAARAAIGRHLLTLTEDILTVIAAEAAADAKTSEATGETA